MKTEVRNLMNQNYSILQISKELNVSYSTICKTQTEIMADHDFNKVKTNKWANNTMMEARAFEIAENYNPSMERELKTLLNNLEKYRP